MQLMPATARRFGVSDTLNPVENVSGAARFLAYLRQDAQIQDLPELLAAYNAGEGAVARYGGIPPYEETREYVRRVLWAYLLSEPPSPVWHRPQVSRWQNLHPGRAVTLFSPTSSPISPLARSSRRGTDVNGAQIVRRTTTEIDVLDRLDQIRRARNRALKLQPQPRPIR